MTKNMGGIDRVLRLLVAAGAVAGGGVLGFSTAGGIVLLVAAAIMVVTSATAFCPLYLVAGVRTTRVGAPAEGGTARGGHRPNHLHRAA